MPLNFGNFIANSWGRSFIRSCRRELQGLAPDPELVAARIRDSAQAIFDASAGSLPDKNARTIYAYCSLTLAAFREIAAETGDKAKAYEFARVVFQKSLESRLRLVMKLWLWFVGDPVGFLSRKSLARIGNRKAGAGMEFDEEKTGETVDLIVRRCAFHQFFVKHGEPDLTPVVCAFDRFWMDMIDRSSRPIRTERPSTISTGGDCCRFRFIRDHDKGDVKPSDVILVQLQKTPYAVREKPCGV